MELKRNTIERFSCVSNVAFGTSAVIYFVIGALGYYTFGINSDGLILNVSKVQRVQVVGWWQQFCVMNLTQFCFFF